LAQLAFSPLARRTLRHWVGLRSWSNSHWPVYHRDSEGTIQTRLIYIFPVDHAIESAMLRPALVSFASHGRCKPQSFPSRHGGRNLLGKPSEMRCRRTGFLPQSGRGMTGVSKGIPSQMTPRPTAQQNRGLERHPPRNGPSRSASWGAFPLRRSWGRSGRGEDSRAGFPGGFGAGEPNPGPTALEEEPSARPHATGLRVAGGRGRGRR